MSPTLQTAESASLAPAFPRVSRRVFFFVFAILGLAVLAPLALTPILPLTDYPNHLARMYILANLPLSSMLQQFYLIEWRPIPNLAMDLIVPALGSIMPLPLAAKFFVAAALLLLAGGTALLHRVVWARWSLWPALAFLFLYNRALLWGFTNFLFGLGLTLVAVAAWIALAQRTFAIRAAIGLLCALLIYFAHFLAFGFFGVMVLGYELSRLGVRPFATRRAAHAAALLVFCFLPPLLILALGSPATAGGGGVEFGRFIRKFDLLFSVFDVYGRSFDIVCFAIAILGMAYAYWRRWIAFAPPLVPPLVLMVVVWLALPTHLFTAFGADHRVPLAMAFLLIAATDWQVGARRAGTVFAATALLMFCVRLGVVAANWQTSGRLYADLMPAFDAMPRGSRVAVAYPAAAVHAETTPLLHFPALAVPGRDAFVSSLFADPAQQPMAFQAAYADLARRTPPEEIWTAVFGAHRDDTIDAALRNYDYIAMVAPRPFTVSAGDRFEPVFVAPRFTLLRVRQAGARD